MFADLCLSQRLERAEAQANIDFVEARAATFPHSDAQWHEIGGAFAMFDGVRSPLTQSFCLGIFEPVTNGSLRELEAFFTKRQAPVFHEVSPLVGVAAASLLSARGYVPVEFTNVLFRQISPGQTFAELRNREIQVRRIEDDEYQLWAQVSARGWSEFEGLGEFMSDLARVVASRKNGFSFLAELNGEPIAAGALTIHNGVALLAGASTVPEGRKRGAQLALLDARLQYAVAHDCDLAMMCALPGSASQRNAERHGFRVAYTRIKWELVARES
ncbi:MAG TPA: GNAT family N-acetyltransferase [Pyrinomonadaceae bacterium]|nr:GNAT family N-acetyltransferase [Pyrinomonadaceae bacterium]